MRRRAEATRSSGFSLQPRIRLGHEGEDWKRTIISLQQPLPRVPNYSHRLTGIEQALFPVYNRDIINWVAIGICRIFHMDSFDGFVRELVANDALNQFGGFSVHE